jgi:flagellar biosynthesis protein FlhG
VVLADASPTGSDVALFCRVIERRTVADVLAGRRSVAEALQPAPGGMHILAGVCGTNEFWESAPSAHDRLVEQLRGLRDRADVVVVDAGNGPSPIARRLWHAAGAVVLVTTTEPASVLDAYTAVKTVAAGGDLPSLWTLVNMAPDAATADNVHVRLARACRRLLAVPCRAAGHVDRTTQVRQSTGRGQPFVLAAPECASSRQIRQVVRLVLEPQLGEKRLKTPGERADFMGHCGHSMVC